MSGPDALSGHARPAACNAGPMAGRWRCLLAVGLALGAVACAGDDDSGPDTTGPDTTGLAGGALTIDALADARSDSCPLPLDDAATAAGVEPAATATGSIETAPMDTTAPTGNTLDVPVLQRLDGVSVSCTATAADGTVDVLLVAGRLDVAGSAGFALLPALSREAALASADLEPIADELSNADVGTDVVLPGDAAVALTRTSVAGAADAALLVWSDDLSRNQVEDVATELDALLR